ncbi:hypothetical protein [Acinetobacter sp. ANC 4173]|uniref:hypothetical protein n=1 Tax=Acinetobacter sp. ANC 4173 TaxID=2529837 RepID=UPI00104061BD|nr:hypothetical protein [Acinetobacter sp. ANC 4173]TCB78884.1 hypothetical protein E0H94_11995 [Acinetobacter sp. ANC 4173]
MRNLLIACICMTCCGFVSASECSIGGFSAPEMKLASYYRSQTATSFNISCDRNYSIAFNSQNLVNSSGLSYVSNGPYRLRTQLNIRGASQNLWGVQMNQRAGMNQKYIISAQLQENPINGVPAGVYRDRIYVNVDF